MIKPLRVTNAFETLGITPTLVISDEELRTAFREAGKSAHPDAGGGDESFARLCQAMDVLSSPSRRLRHWLELRGVEIDSRGAVDPALMDLFGSVGEVTQRAESLIRRREDAKSALGLALLERETHLCREAVEDSIRKVDRAVAAECGVFPVVANAERIDIGAVSKTVRNLAFLEKWKAGLRALFSRLV